MAILYSLILRKDAGDLCLEPCSWIWHHGQCEDLCISLNSVNPKTGTLILQYNKNFGWGFSFFSGSCLMGLLVICSIGTATHYQPDLMKKMHSGLCGSL